jgi:hypothetical protein
LRNAQLLENENYYGTNLNSDLDSYDNEGYVGLFEGESDEFVTDIKEVNNV